MIKTFLPLLKSSKNSRIINLSSVAGLIGGYGFSLYSGNKHAIEGTMKSIRQELKAWNIHVSNVNPAFMK